MTLDPLRLQFDIECPPEHAFAVWTTRLSSWWPKGHSASGHPETVVILEPHLGGRIIERTPNGTENEWATDVVLTFVYLGDGATRLEIMHSGWERLGAEGREWRDSNTAGWRALLPAFIAATTH